MFVQTLQLTASSFCFFLLAFLMKHQGGSITINTISSQSAEFFANICSSFIFVLAGPKIGFFGLFTTCAIGAFVLMIANEAGDTTLMPICISICKFGIAASFCMCYLAYVTITPTVLSATMFGLGNVIARTTTVMAPLLAEADEEFALWCIIIVACTAAGASFFLIPDLSHFY